LEDVEKSPLRGRFRAQWYVNIVGVEESTKGTTTQDEGGEEGAGATIEQAPMRGEGGAGRAVAKETVGGSTVGVNNFGG